MLADVQRHADPEGEWIFTGSLLQGLKVLVAKAVVFPGTVNDPPAPAFPFVLSVGNTVYLLIEHSEMQMFTVLKGKAAVFHFSNER